MNSNIRLPFDAAELPANYGISIRQLTRQIQRVLQKDRVLADAAVRGEISSLKQHASGHLYFTLKEDDAQLRCVMWRDDVALLPFRPADGQKVVTQGQVEFYAPRGEIQFRARLIRFAGRGALHEAFELLKNELAAEGLFDQSRKRALPAMPRCIGLITSPSGSVVHDMVTILHRRWPLARLLLIPAAVQGFAAVPDLLQALHRASQVPELDVVIVARGGGSAEDMWCFNDEELARAAAAFPRPLVSAVGHETDFCILDFVADQRAPTPSAAAELVVPEMRQFVVNLATLRRRLHRAASADVRTARVRLRSLAQRRVLTEPRARFDDLRTRVQDLRERARGAARRRVKIERQALRSHENQLRALDPQRVLERGYAIVNDAASRRLVTSVGEAGLGQELTVVLADGSLGVRVEKLPVTNE